MLNAQSMKTTSIILEKHYLAASPKTLVKAAAWPKNHHQQPSLLLLKLPLSILTKILRYILIPDLSHPQILPVTPAELNTYREVHPGFAILETCRLMRRLGETIFYSESTFTTSSPSNSYDLDRGIHCLPGWQRQLITSIALQIDWADELWAKFPLAAVALCELKRLQRLEIFFVQKVSGGDGRLLWDGAADREIQEAKRREARGWKRDGNVAEVMLKAEKKMFGDLVGTVKALRVFKLVGFADEEYARKLELLVSARAALRAGGGPKGWGNLSFLGSS